VAVPQAANPQTELPPATQIAHFEAEYLTNADFSARAELIYKISDVGTPEAIPALGRIFASENDTELKTEVLSLLADIDNQDDQKLAILSAAVGADQPKDVREAAIDALTDLESPQRGLPILQSLSNDPDAEIRDAVKDAVALVQSLMSQSQ
jgi:HEAT repeat protein